LSTAIAHTRVSINVHPTKDPGVVVPMDAAVPRRRILGDVLKYGRRPALAHQPEGVRHPRREDHDYHDSNWVGNYIWLVGSTAKFASHNPHWAHAYDVEAILTLAPGRPGHRSL
jgi:hypothetical protein